MERIPLILILDDEQDICLMLKGIFKRFDISSISSNSIKSAKFLLCSANPTHIVMDYILPDSQGKNFITYLSKFHPDVKIVLLTGDSEISGESYGEVFSIIQKPFTKNTIKEVFQDFICEY